MSSDFEKKINANDRPATNAVNDDYLARRREKRKEQKNKAKQGARSVLFFMPLAISTLITLLLLGFVELVNASFRFGVLTSPDFWYKFFIFQLSVILITLAITFTMAKYYRRNDRKYIETNEKIQKHVDKDNENPFIDDGALEEDTNRKILAWERKIKYKIEKWRRKITYKTEADFNKKENTEENAPKSNDTLSFEEFSKKQSNFELPKKRFLKKPIKTFLQRKKIKRNIKIKQKIEHYNHMLTKEYILENIDSLKVKYNKVTAQALTSGVSPSNTESGNEPLKADRMTILIKKNSARIAASAASAALITSMVLEVQNLDLTSWVRILVKLIIVIYNSLMAFMDFEDYFKATDMYESSVRLSTLNRIENKMKKKGAVK